MPLFAKFSYHGKTLYIILWQRPQAMDMLRQQADRIAFKKVFLLNLYPGASHCLAR
jgi:hypothetical protein